MCVWQETKGDTKRERPAHYLPPSQSTNTKHRGKEEKGNYNRQEDEKQQFWQSCADNFPGADLAKEATSVELRRQPLGCLGCFSSDVLQSTSLCRRSNLVCSARCERQQPGTPGAPRLMHCDGYQCLFNWQKKNTNPALKQTRSPAANHIDIYSLSLLSPTQSL